MDTSAWMVKTFTDSYGSGKNLLNFGVDLDQGAGPDLYHWRE